MIIFKWAKVLMDDLASGDVKLVGEKEREQRERGAGEAAKGRKA